jgi:hypothetical protein
MRLFKSKRDQKKPDAARTAANLRRCVLEALESRQLLTALTIAQENQLPGTPQSVWDVPGAGDSSIQGFTADISYNVGSTVQFKIDDTGSAPYHVDIYRIGYYQGNGARLVATLSNTQTQRIDQPSPLTDPSTGLVDAGNWSVDAQWAIPADATSGVYMAKVTREDTGGASQIPFIVRNDASTATILYQTDDMTWQAYNQWGGNSLYLGSGPGAAPAAGRAYAVSYNRPIVDRGQSYGYGATNYFFLAEYPMVRFLEKNGYDVTYQAEVDAARYPSHILNHKIWTSAGHDEYWSAEQRTALENARDAGVDLAFFSGNEDYWKTRWGNSLDSSSTPYRTIITYKESLAGAKIDPSPTWTGEWRDGRFSPPSDGGRPENSLSGQIWEVNRGPNDNGTSMNVPYSDASMRLWRNTSVASLQPGQIATIGDTVLGYEWDEDVDNGSRPAGLIDMSSTTEAVSQLDLDLNEDVGPGTATHSLTLYRAASGALVFGAGTVQWSWGLDATHDGTSSSGGTAAIDPVIQQATINLLADMGAQPTTLMAGMVAASASTDHIAPTVSISMPPNNQIPESGGFATISGTATDGGGGVVAGVEVSVDGGATWHPASGHASWSYSWSPTALGNVSIEVRASDDSANLSAPTAAQTFQVTAGDGTSRLMSPSAIPAVENDDDASSIEVGVRFKSDVAGSVLGIRFYKGVLNTGTHIGELWTNTGTLLASGTFTNESASGWQTLTFATPVQVSANTYYVASYHTDVGHYSDSTGYFAGSGIDHAPLHAPQDGTAGSNGVYHYGPAGSFPNNTFDSANYFVDVVFSSGTVTQSGPVATSETPSPNATNVAVGSTINITFNKAVVASTVQFNVVDAGNNPIPGAVTYNATTFTATFTPSTSLTSGTSYTATVGGATDTSGNAMTTPVTWSFATAAAVTGGVSIWPNSVVPVVTSDPDAQAIEVGVKFRSDVAGNVLGIRFYKGSLNTGAHTGSLWSNTGQLLATGTFTNETSSGWQTMLFASPVAINANTTYVASYHTTVGHYADNVGYFATAGTDAPPLHALQDGADGNDGVFLYGTGGFPNQSSNSTNFWTDVVFAAGTTNIAPSVTSTNPAAGATGIAVGTSISATFNTAMDATTINSTTVQLLNASQQPVPATVSYNANTLTVTVTPMAALANSTTYTLSITGGTGGVANSSETVLAATFTASFTTAASVSSTPISIMPATATPATISVNDASAVELGVKFRSDVAGFISGIRFYKGSTNTGTHTGSLWSSTGTLLATGTFSGESASGWQTLTFATPVAINANTTYVASYHTAVGFYSATGGAFASAGIDNAPLHALASGVDGPNGVYLYGGGGFPNQSYNNTNYFVDVTFQQSLTDTTPPTVTTVTPVNGATGVAASTTVTAIFSESIQSSTLLFTLKDASNNSVSATVVYNDTNKTATLTPFSALNFGATYTASVSGAKDLAGNTMTSTTTWSFTVAPAPVAPTVVSSTPASGATGVAVTVAPTATFSVAMNSATINSSSFQVLGPGNVAVAANVTYNSANLTATVTPLSPLAAGTTYIVVVHSGASGVQNTSGTPMAADVTWTFTTSTVVVNQWTQNTAAAFNTGTYTNTAYNTGVQLTGAFSDTFNGTSLSTTNWTNTALSTIGGGTRSVTVSSGQVSIKGASLTTKASVSGPTVEAVARLNSVGQAVGITNAAIFMSSGGAVSGSGFIAAAFSTGSSGTSLLAVVNVNGTRQQVSLGSRLTGFHTYRVAPTATGVQFLIDGVVKTTISLAIPAGTKMMAGAASYTGGSTATALVVQSESLSYPASGQFISSVFDSGKTATWGIASWVATLPAGTSILVETSSGNTATPDGTWSAWQAVSNGGTVVSPASRYIRYRLTLATTSPFATPTLTSITVNWS